MLNVVVSMLMVSAGSQAQPALGTLIADCVRAEAREHADSGVAAEAAAEAVAGACRPRIDARLAAMAPSSTDPAVAERERNLVAGLRRDIAARLPALALKAVETERAGH